MCIRDRQWGLEEIDKGLLREVTSHKTKPILHIPDKVVLMMLPAKLFKIPCTISCFVLISLRLSV